MVGPPREAYDALILMQRLMADTDTKRIRPLSKSVFLCQAKCCDSGASQEAWQVCERRRRREVRSHAA